MILIPSLLYTLQNLQFAKFEIRVAIFAGQEKCEFEAVKAFKAAGYCLEDLYHHLRKVPFLQKLTLNKIYIFSFKGKSVRHVIFT